MKTVCYEEYIDEDARHYALFKDKKRNALGNFELTDKEYASCAEDYDVVVVDDSNMRPFNLEDALNGAKVVTRTGESVRIICTDAKRSANIVVLVEDSDNFEFPQTVHPNGLLYSEDFQVSRDLFLLKE